MRFRYRSKEEMKDSGMDYIGNIPLDWKVKQLNTVTHKIAVGLATSVTQYYRESGTPIIRNMNIKENWFDDSDILYLEESFAKKEKNKMVKKDDIILVHTGSNVGLACVVPEKFDNTHTFTTLIVRVNRNEVFPKFLMYHFNSGLGKVQVNLLKEGIGKDNLNVSSFKFYKCTLPNHYLQEKIIEFLDKKTAQFNTIISKKEALIQTLEEAKKSLISEVVTGKVKVVKTSEGYKLVERKKEEMKDSGVEWLGRIPFDWRIGKVKYSSYINKNVLSENTDEDYLVRYIDIGSVTSNGQIENIQEFKFKDAPSRARRIVKSKDILVSTVRTYLKAITSIDKTQDGLICSTGFAVLTPKESIDYRYLAYLIRSTAYIDEIVSRSKGVSYPAITSSEIGGLSLILPRIDEQELIGYYLDKNLNELNIIIEKNSKQIQKLKEAKQSLISEAVTGKIEILD